MIDYILSFTDQATAIDDPVVGQYHSGNAWRGDCVIPGVQVWNPSQDTTSAQTVMGQTVTVVNRTYLPGFYLVISKTARDAALDSHTALVMVTDRELANSGASPAQFILYANEPIATISQMRLQPVFAGSNYPFSGQ